MLSVFTLRLHISVTLSRIGLLSLWSAGARCDKLIFPNQPHQLRSAWRKADRWSGLLLKGIKKNNKKKNCSLAAVTVNTRQQNEQYQIISQLLSFSWKQTGILKPLSQHMVSCMHHCYQGDHFLSLAFLFFFFFWVILFVTRDSRGKTISFYTFIGVLVNRITVL